jgi:hypothetical protein
MRWLGYPEQEAVRRAVDLLRSRIVDVEQEASGLARAAQGLNDDTRLYIHGLKVWYQANYFWSLKCRRFIVDQVDETAHDKRSQGPENLEP